MGLGDAKKEKVVDDDGAGFDLPTEEKAPTDNMSAMEAEFYTLAHTVAASHVFCGVVGHEGTGKSGVVMDAFMKGWLDNHEDAEKHQARGDFLNVIDFDGGGAVARSTHYGNTPHIRCWDPWVMQDEDRTAYHYPETHNRVMNILRFAVARSEAQKDPEYEGAHIWGLFVTAVDLWDSVAKNNMRITDLGLAADAIAAADSRGAGANAGTGQRVQQQFDWAIRSTRFHQLTAMCRKLVQNGVRVFWETHYKNMGFADDGTKLVPDWEKHSSNYLHQILHLSKVQSRTADGVPEDRWNYIVDFRKCKTNPNLEGQERIIMTTSKGEAPIWYGLPELRDEVI